MLLRLCIFTLCKPLCFGSGEREAKVQCLGTCILAAACRGPASGSASLCGMSLVLRDVKQGMRWGHVHLRGQGVSSNCWVAGMRSSCTTQDDGITQAHSECGGST